MKLHVHFCLCKIPHLAMVMDNGQQTSPRNSSSAFLFLEGGEEDLEKCQP